jgi:hypothetical protein
MSGAEDREILSTVRNLDSYDFERFIASLWELQGWETEVTGRTSDRGTDVIAKIQFPTEIEMHIQAKCYGENSSVSGPEMQKYGSLTRKPNVDVATVVTSGSFTSQATSLADEFDIRLVDSQSLVTLIRELEAEDLLSEYLDSADLKKVEVKDDTDDMQLYSGTSDQRTELEPSQATASGEYIQIDVIGAEWQNGYLKGIDNRLKELNNPIDGVVLALEVANNSDIRWSFVSEQSSSRPGGITVFDTEGFSYEAVYSNEYGAKKAGNLSGWSWDRVDIQPQSRSRVATWFDIPEGAEIRRLQYTEEVWRAVPDETSGVEYESEEQIEMSFSEPVREIIGDIPQPIRDSIE